MLHQCFMMTWVEVLMMSQYLYTHCGNPTSAPNNTRHTDLSWWTASYPLAPSLSIHSLFPCRVPRLPWQLEILQCSRWLNENERLLNMKQCSIYKQVRVSLKVPTIMDTVETPETRHTDIHIKLLSASMQSINLLSWINYGRKRYYICKIGIL